MALRISLAAVFTITAILLAYVVERIDSIFVSNAHDVLFRLNPCEVSAEYVILEMHMVTLFAALLLLVFLFLYTKCNLVFSAPMFVLSGAMLGILLALGAPVVRFHITGIVVF